MEEAKQYFESGVEYLKQGQINDAKNEFEKAAKIDPNLGTEEEIFDQLNDAIRSDACHHLAQAHLTEGLRTAAEGGNPEKNLS